jgi:hypothetical protein
MAGYDGSASTVSGPPGYTGSVGYDGSASTVSGPLGYSGSKGYDGSASTVSGPPGYAGSVGSGYTGSRSTVAGPTGPPGFNGSAGGLGPVGFAGSIGSRGFAGSIGYAGSAGPIAGSNTQIIYNSGGAAAGSLNLTWDGTNLYVNGGVNATGDITAFYSSDERLKINVTPIENALAKTLSLNGVTFNWNELAIGKSLEIREPGVIAQQVQAILPEAVALRDNGYLGVRYEKLVPLLIEAIKELSTELADVKKMLQ